MNPYVRADRDRWDLYFDLERTLRYHRKRQGFFENMQVAFSIASAVAGTAAFLSVKTWIAVHWAQSLTFVVAFLAIVALVTRPSERARKHADLFDKFTDLLKEATVPKALSETELHGLNAKRKDLEKTEPKHSRALNAVCYDETALALGVDEQYATRFQRLFAHWLP
jgi:hypothetical protein